MHINIDESAGAQVTTSGELSYNIAKGQGIDADFSDIGQNFKLILTGNSSHLKTDCDIIPGKIYLIGELRRNSGTTSVSDLLTFGKKSELTNMQVYCRVFKLDHSRIYNKESDLSSRINDPDFSPSKK